MTEQEGFAEAVLVFEADLMGVASEMRLCEFDAVTEGAATLERFAASVARAAYVVVGTALSVRGVVFFSFKVDEEGHVDRSFNVPLQYLMEHAGPGPDLGTGPIRLACRGQCPVPWHSMNLWEPQKEGEADSLQIVQRAIWRNRLGLKPRGKANRLLEDNFVLEDPLASQRKLETRLTETFGEEGRVNLEALIRQHNEQIEKISARYRTDLERQQQTYLDQIRNSRDEIQKLKSALRHEQERSRRLQSLLRGEPS
ncbi:MAG: hypothetical protein R3E82_07505 [Pseudomonadales bacterium]